MKKFLIGGGIVIIVVVAVIVLLLGNINTIVKKGVETIGPKVLQAPVTVRSVNISIFSGEGELSGLTIGNPKGFKTDNAFQLDGLKVALDVESVTSDKVHVKNLVIDSPKITYEGTFGKSNLSELQANAAAFSSSGKTAQPAEKGKESGGAKKNIQIDHVIIKNGSINVSMPLLQGRTLDIPLPTLELSDIGKGGNTTIAGAMEEILAAVNRAVIPAVKSGVANLDQQLKKGTDAIKGEAQKGLDSIKGLFGK